MSNRLVLDHDHKTGEIRGVICSRCNSGIGALGDNVAGIERVIEYLKKPLPKALFMAIPPHSDALLGSERRRFEKRLVKTIRYLVGPDSGAGADRRWTGAGPFETHEMESEIEHETAREPSGILW